MSTREGLLAALDPPRHGRVLMIGEILPDVLRRYQWPAELYEVEAEVRESTAAVHQAPA